MTLKEMYMRVCTKLAREGKNRAGINSTPLSFLRRASFAGLEAILDSGKNEGKKSPDENNK